MQLLLLLQVLLLLKLQLDLSQSKLELLLHHLLVRMLRQSRPRGEFSAGADFS